MLSSLDNSSVPSEQFLALEEDEGGFPDPLKETDGSNRGQLHFSRSNGSRYSNSSIGLLPYVSGSGARHSFLGPPTQTPFWMERARLQNALRSAKAPSGNTILKPFRCYEERTNKAAVDPKQDTHQFKGRKWNIPDHAKSLPNLRKRDSLGHRPIAPNSVIPESIKLLNERSSKTGPRNSILAHISKYSITKRLSSKEKKTVPNTDSLENVEKILEIKTGCSDEGSTDCSSDGDAVNKVPRKSVINLPEFSPLKEKPAKIWRTSIRKRHEKVKTQKSNEKKMKEDETKVKEKEEENIVKNDFYRERRVSKVVVERQKTLIIKAQQIQRQKTLDAERKRAREISMNKIYGECQAHIAENYQKVKEIYDTEVKVVNKHVAEMNNLRDSLKEDKPDDQKKHHGGNMKKLTKLAYADFRRAKTSSDGTIQKSPGEFLSHVDLNQRVNTAFANSEYAAEFIPYFPPRTGSPKAY